jgi:hypothetical protein
LVNAPAFAHDCSLLAAAVAPAAVNFVLPPPVPKMKLRAKVLLTD